MMRRWPLLLLAALLAAGMAGAWLWLREPSDPVGRDDGLIVWGTSDEALVQPLLTAYRARHPATTIRYVEMDGASMDRRVRADLAAGRPSADLLVSTAMDLQVRLVNDGLTLPHISANAAALPPWARWRGEVFGISFEPAVMVFDRARMAGRTIPQSRADLLEAINREPDFWRGRVGTYDARRSGTGYLLASQDTRQASDSGALFGAFGAAQAQLAVESEPLVRGLKSGQLIVVYNMLASYARRQQARGADIQIVYPRDFTLALMRTAVIPRNAPHRASAHAFLEYLLSMEGQRILGERAGLFAIREDSAGSGIAMAQSGIVRPIPLGVGLLVYLDAHKRRRLLDNWSSLVIRPRPAATE